MSKRNCLQCENFYKVLLARMNKRNEIIKQYIQQIFSIITFIQECVKDDFPDSHSIIIPRLDFLRISSLSLKIKDAAFLPVDMVISDMDMVNSSNEFKPCEGQFDFLKELDDSLKVV